MTVDVHLGKNPIILKVLLNSLAHFVLTYRFLKILNNIQGMDKYPYLCYIKEINTCGMTSDRFR